MIPTPSALVLILGAFATGAVFAAATAWFVWIFHERRTLRIQARMFDEAAKWAREDAQAGQEYTTTHVTAFMPVTENWQEVRQ